MNAWSDGDRGLDALIRTLSRIDGLERIRYTTSHPADMSDALIAAHGEADKLMPYLHLPVQSGSDRILKAMNRSHSADSYLRTIEKVRAALALGVDRGWQMEIDQYQALGCQPQIDRLQIEDATN